MKYKYVMLSGFAFGEKSDLKKLNKLAKEGWILDSVPFLFYKLRKDKPQKIDYTVDYQPNYDDDYFLIFNKAGWTHIATIGEHMHIFSALEGTKPIYSDTRDQIEQYMPIIKQTKNGALVSFPILLILLFLMSYLKLSGWISIALLVCLIGAWVVFVFNFLPFLGYLYRVRKMKRQLR